MNAVMNWMNQHFVPVATRISKNTAVMTLQESITAVLPMIFIGSLVTLVSILRDFIPGFPDLSPISTFSFGLTGLFVAFLVPYTYMRHTKRDDLKIIAGSTGVAAFLMMLHPQIADGALSVPVDALGAGGLFVSLIVGAAASFVFAITSRWKLISRDSGLPDFIRISFETMLPIALILTAAWLTVFVVGVDMIGLVEVVFTPLTAVSQSFWGFVLIVFLFGFTYSFGISNWLMTGIMMPFWLEGMAENIAAVANGADPQNVNLHETILSGWIFIGGVGATLPLVFMMAFAARAKRVRAVGRISVVPSMFNINEPVVFGAPIAFNPILMVPFWINCLIPPAITWLVLKGGLVPIPSETYLLWYTPFGLSTFLVTKELTGLILLAAMLVLTTITWLPFFKIFDNQVLREERAVAEREAAEAVATSKEA